VTPNGVLPHRLLLPENLETPAMRKKRGYYWLIGDYPLVDLEVRFVAECAP
jgi:hypothetical protein